MDGKSRTMKNNLTILELIEVAKTSEHGLCWFSEKGPIYISKEGNMTPAFTNKLPVTDDNI